MAEVVNEDTLKVDVNRAKRLADGSDVNASGVTIPRVYYDPQNDQYMMFTSVYGVQQTNYAEFIFDRDFNIVSKRLIAGPVNFGDAGIACIGFEEAKDLLCIGGFGNERRWLSISNFTTRPLPALSKIGWDKCPLSTSMTAGADVHHLFVVSGRIYHLTELLENNGQWHIALGIGPRRCWRSSDSTDLRGKYQFAHSLLEPVPFSSDFEKTSYGHPFYATILKHHYLLFTNFRNCYWPLLNVGLKWAHEIWAIKISPTYFIDTTKWLPALFVYPGASLPVVLDLPSRRAALFAYKVSGNVNVTLRYSNDINHAVSGDGYYLEENISISPGQALKYLIEPAPPVLYISADNKDCIGELSIIFYP